MTARGTVLTLRFEVQADGHIGMGFLNCGNGNLDHAGVKNMISLLPFALGRMCREVLEETSKSPEEDRAKAIHNFSVGIMLNDDEEVQSEHKECKPRTE